jgi:hypothetical protein
MRGSRLKTVNIKGIDKMTLLKTLWDYQYPALFFSFNPDVPVPGWDDALAREALKQGYIDYFQGRAIKADLSKDEVYSYNYDKGSRPTFEEIAAKLKRQ